MNTILTYPEPDRETVEQLTARLKCHPVLARLLCARGITTESRARRFLNPSFDSLADPFSITDMEKAVQRIYTAVVNQEKILIFGDFDADGVTATALLTDFLEYCGADVSWYIPHRMKEGYSLQNDHIDHCMDRDIDLIITVDCGVSSNDAIARAADEDIDVIVTDHHEPGPHLPDAAAVIDPKRKDCTSGLDFLAGVGVAFFLVVALRTYFRGKGFWNKLKEPNLSQYLDLFAIGTIGDMTPLIHENRVLCIAGLKKIRQAGRLGLKSLMDVSRIDASRLDSDDISFKIVPRINAAGRISHARICVSQLTSPDIISAEKTAAVLEDLNVRRRQIEQDIITDIENRLHNSPALLEKRLLFLWDSQWDPGVLGIAASKLSRKYGCPVILMSKNGDEAVGSGRSINNINIHQALSAHENYLEKFGGHAMASGLTVKTKNLELLSESLQEYMNKTYGQHSFQKTLAIDAVLDFEQITFDLAQQLDRLRPFGIANLEPVFLCRDIRVISSTLIGGAHRKMILSSALDLSARNTVEAFHFNIENPENQPDYFSQIAFRLKINKFKTNSAQMIIEDL